MFNQINQEPFPFSLRNRTNLARRSAYRAQEAAFGADTGSIDHRRSGAAYKGHDVSDFFRVDQAADDGSCRALLKQIKRSGQAA